MRHWLGAIALAAIALTLALPAAAEVYRIQAKPLNAFKTRTVRPDLSPDPPPAVEVPGWLDWALRLMDGRAFTFAQPSWEGLLSPGVRWRLGLEAGLKGRMDLGYGPALVVNGRLKGPWGGVDNSTTVLASAGGLSWMSEVTLGRTPWTLNLRAWDSPGASSVGRSATLTLRQGF